MKDKLRELAERWKADADGHPVPTNNEDRGYSNALFDCADELLAILDTEGDGRAGGVDKEAVLALINPLLSAGTFDAPDWAIRVAAICMDCNIAESPHPARSGVVSDDDVQRAIVAAESYSSATRIGWEAMRSAIDAAIQGERHEH